MGSTERRDRERRMHRMQGVPLFTRCTRRELERVDELGTVVPVAAGRTLTLEGAPGRECFVLLEGTASVARAAVPLGLIQRGSVAGELALLDRVPRSATVTTRTPSRLMVLDPTEFADLLELAPSVSDLVLETAARRRDALETAGRVTAH